MEAFARSRFWRAMAVALVLALGWVGLAVSGDPPVLPVAHAGGVIVSQPGGGSVVYTTDESGSVLYAWSQAGWVEKWSWDLGQVTRKPIFRIDQPGTPGPREPLGPGVPPLPGGTPDGRPR